MKLYIDQIKPKLGNRAYNLETMLQVIDRAIDEKNEVVVFPELSLTGHSLEDIAFEVGIDKVPQELSEKSKEIDIIFGAVEIGEEDYPYNTAYYLSEGKVLGKHRKVYLSDYGYSTESRCFMKGNSFDVIETKFGKIGILLGDEIYHQSAQYILAQKGVKYLFNLINGVGTLKGDKENVGSNTKLVAKANSVMNGIFTIVANRAGVEDGLAFYGNSFVVSPDGNICIEGEYFKEGNITCNLDEGEIRRARTKYPFFKSEDRRLTVCEVLSLEKKSK